MIKNAIIAAVVVVIILGAVLLVFSNQSKDNPLNISTNNATDSSNSSINQQDQGNSTANTGTSNNKVAQSKNKSTNNPKVKISAAEAKRIVQKVQEGTGVTVGTPKLSKLSVGYVYVVPLYKNGKKVGTVGVDPNTGDTGEV